MRKVFSVMVLAVLATSMVWAQDEEEAAGEIKVSAGTLKISGDVKVGVRADGDLRKRWDPSSSTVGEYDEKSATMNIYGYSDDIDDNKTAMRSDLTATYTNGSFGAKINVRNDFVNVDYDSIRQGTAKFTEFSVSNAYGWVDLFGNHVSAYGGIIDDDIWGTGWLGGTATDKNYDASGLKGVRLEIKPIQGLSFGIALPFGYTEEYSSVDLTKYYQFGTFYGADEVRGNTFGDLFAHSIIGASFKNEALAAAVSVKLKGGLYGYPIKDKAPDYSKDRDVYYGISPDILFGFKLTAVPKLTLILDGELNDFFYSEDTYWYGYYSLPKYDIYLKAAYQITDPLSAGLRLQLKGQGGTGISDLDEQDPLSIGEKADVYSKLDKLGIRVFADYAVTPNIKPGLEVEFMIRGDTAYNEKVYDKLTDDGKKLATHAGLSHIYFKPRCAFNLGSGLTFNVWDKITLVMANGLDESGPYAIQEWQKSPKELSGYVLNTFQLDFVWSF